jgi:hypothetical protein
MIPMEYPPAQYIPLSAVRRVAFPSQEPEQQEDQLMDSIRRLRKSVKKANKDTFEIGTVIKWTAANRYTYAVIKTAIGWASTARPTNSFVPHVMEFDELVEILGRSETSDIAVATAWEAID